MELSSHIPTSAHPVRKFDLSGTVRLRADVEAPMDQTIPAPRTRPRSTDERSVGPDEWYRQDEWAAAAAAAEDVAETGLWIRRIVLGLLVLAFLFLADTAGFDLGPAGSHRAACAATGGHEIDFLLLHRCAPAS
jgi:hypothetical protein